MSMHEIVNFLGEQGAGLRSAHYGILKRFGLAAESTNVITTRVHTVHLDVRDLPTGLAMDVIYAGLRKRGFAVAPRNKSTELDLTKGGNHCTLFYAPYADKGHFELRTNRLGAQDRRKLNEAIRAQLTRK
ncbi:MAG: hypothetical protein V1722_02650 [Candidatus Micrarchaeota archaeon]